MLDRQIELARAAATRPTVLAPSAGRVLEVAAHAGEVSGGPLLSLGDLSAMVAIAEVYQSDVPEVKVGDPAEVVILGKKVAGQGDADLPAGRQEHPGEPRPPAPCRTAASSR